MIAVGLGGCSQEEAAPETRANPGVSPEAVKPAASVSDQIEQLMLGARTALNERRLLAPAGNNAIESYLAVLQLEASHVGARQALLELIPPASDAVESAIAGGELDEAQRRFDLFKQMGVSELRLNPIRARLAAARAESERLAAAANEADVEAAAPTTTPGAALPPVATTPAAPTTTPTPPAVTATAPAEPPTPEPAVAPATAQSQPAPAPTAEPEPAAAAAAAPPAVADIVEPRQIVDAVPSYPAMARQRRLEGWVELEIAIGSDGEVGEVSVVHSEPAKVFDREAVRAAQRWRFEPRRENGVAVATRVRKTLNFKLAAS